MINHSSLDAKIPAGSERTFCSWSAGWREVLLRTYRDVACVDDYQTTPTPDQKLVLVTAGSCAIEAMNNGVWRGASYSPGHIGLVAPGEAARLRWHGPERHTTIQLHIPGAIMSEVSGELARVCRARFSSLGSLSLLDPVVATTMQALHRAARTGAPGLHAETTAHFLASHLLLRSNGINSTPKAELAGAAARQLDDYMQANLANPISLGDLAKVAGMGRFQVLRMAKRLWGETPQRRLTRMRMVLAQRLLVSTSMTVTEIALECGYSSPGNFATAFRRFSGRSPSEHRQPG